MTVCMKKYYLWLVVLLVIFPVPGIWSQSVTPGGSLNYSIPINIPAGTAGMMPELTLEYNSQSGNGYVGMGWGLSGISAFCRDERYPINFDGSDHYVYNGQKLIYENDGYYHTPYPLLCKQPLITDRISIFS